MTGQGLTHHMALQVPKPHALVKVTARQQLAVRVKGDCINRLVEANEKTADAGGMHIPQAKLGISAAAYDCLTIGAEADRTDNVGMTLKNRGKLASLHIPHADHVVIAAGCQELTVRAEGYGCNQVEGGVKRIKPLPTGSIPNA